MAKARAWRKTREKERRASEARRAPVMAESAMPTQERLAKAHGAFEIGGNARSGRIVRLTDTPLERIYAEHRLTIVQFEALHRFRIHWYLGGVAGELRAIDLNRTGADWHALAHSERELMHRQAFVQGWEILPLLERAVVNNVVLVEVGLTSAGAELGYRSPYRGRQAALELLQGGGDILARAGL